MADPTNPPPDDKDGKKSAKAQAAARETRLADLIAAKMAGGLNKEQATAVATAQLAHDEAAD